MDKQTTFESVLNAFLISSKAGKPAIQGPHHVAQKSIKITFPAY